MKQIMALLVLLALTACGSSAEPKPPDMAYGRDLCDRCGMVIDDARYAAALLLDNGQVRRFDDAGELFKYTGEHADESVRAWFVHDHQTQAWLRGEGAFYLVSKQVASPMGTGVAIFAERSAAESFAKSLPDAKVYTFNEARALLSAPGKP